MMIIVTLPKGHENSNIQVKPNLSRLMVGSDLMPEHTFDQHMMESIEMEYGFGDAFKKTRLFWQLPILAEGEEVLWNYIGTEGLFNKKAKFIMAFTNLRAYIYDFYDHSFANLLVSSIDDVLVMNSHRESTNHRMGSFHSTGRMGMRIGTHSSMGSSRSQTVGDVIFMKDGEQVISFGNVSDPQGIVRLVKSVMKNITIRESINYNIELPDSLKDSEIPKKELIDFTIGWEESSSNEKIKKCNTLLKKYPDKMIFLALVELLQESENWKDLEKASSDMIEKNRHLIAVESLCVSLFNQDKTSEAIDELNKYLKLYPDSEKLKMMKQQVAEFESKISKSIICSKCKKDNDPGSKFCNSCGKKLEDGCKKCGKVNPKNSKFCNDCGESLEQT